MEMVEIQQPDREESGVNEIEAEFSGKSRIYDLNGMQLMTPKKNGINIVVTPEGTIKRSF